jgi:hypothetical protein
LPRTKVGGLRSTVRGVSADERTVLPAKKQDKFQFCSANAGFILSLRRRRTRNGPDGETIVEVPRSKRDNPIDWVRFENNYFETDDPELAQLIRDKPNYGFEKKRFWALDDQKAAQDEALERELRAKLAERPDIAERVLRQSEKDDFSVPQQG